MSKKNALSPDIFRTVVLRHVEPMRRLFTPDVLIKPPSNHYFGTPHAQFIYPLAYFYKTRFPGNRYFMDPAILAAVRALGDHIILQIDASIKDPRNPTDSKGQICQRLLAFWMDAYVLVKSDLSPSACRTWETAMKRALLPLVKKLEGCMTQRYFNSYSFGTSANHAILYAVAVCLGGRLLNKHGWRKLAETFTDRFVDSQHPDGYWPEHGGPVTSYTPVSVAGVARMAALLNKKSYKEALARTWRYFETISYPDFTFVRLIDRRSRDSNKGTISRLWGYFGFSYWPGGRAFALEAARAKMERQESLAGDECARWLENFVHFRRGAIPQSYQGHWTGWRRLTATGSGMIAFLRTRGWQLNFCVNPVVCSQSCFGLDYLNLFSLWHRATGRIVSCSQDKHHPEHGSFYVPGADSLGALVGGNIHDLAQSPFLNAFYDNGFCGRISARVTSRTEVRLTIAQVAQHRTGEMVYFNLPLCAGLGDEIRIGKRRLTLTAKKLKITVPAGVSIGLGHGVIGLRADVQGTLHFPCRPYNSYNMKDHSSNLSAAFLRWDFPLQGSRPIQIHFHILNS